MSTKRTCPCLIFDARRSNQHFRVPPNFSMATEDSFSRVGLLVGKPDEGQAPALHIVIIHFISWVCPIGSGHIFA